MWAIEKSTPEFPSSQSIKSSWLIICLHPCGRVEQPGGCTYATRVAYTPVLAGLAAILPCFEVLQLSVFKNLDNDQHFQCSFYVCCVCVCDLRSASWCMARHLPTYIYEPPVRASPGSVLLSARLGRAYGFFYNERKYTKNYFVLGHHTVYFLINTIHYRSKLHLQTRGHRTLPFGQMFCYCPTPAFDMPWVSFEIWMLVC